MKVESQKSNANQSVLNLTPLELDSLIPGARPFSLWLIPNQNDRRPLAKVIEDLANQYSAPVFEPHVTIYTGIYTHEDKLEEIIVRSAEVVQPISLVVKGISFSDSFFKTLFIEFEHNPILIALSQGIRSELRYQEQYDLRPHLSLLYKKISATRKKAIADQLNLAKLQVHFDEVAVVSPANLSQGWADVNGWDICFRRRLDSCV